MHVLPSRLKARARELRLTDADVARRAGLTERRYGHYVTGTRRPDYETLLRLCGVLGTSPNDLLGYEAKPEADEAARLKEQADAAWNALDDEGRVLAVDLLEALVNNRLRTR
ncbi:MAG TPA: helix-turn-helix transcriptional regulator [Azospirillum sp.]|nr:helix-turn-helix transcriptional regulator [Azospirillum sp.]